jgi:hypothetical protein
LVLICSLLQAAVFGIPGIALGQATGFTLDARVPPDLQRCVSPDDIYASYLHALSAYGVHRTVESNLVVVLRTHPGSEPGSTLIELSARASGRALGRSQLHVTKADCDALPRALGQAVARFVRQASAAEANRPLLPLPPGEFETQPSASGLASSSESSKVVVLGAGAGIFGGALPSAALALQLQAATANRPLSMRLRATLLWPQQRALTEGVITATGYELSLEACGSFSLPRWQRLELRLCLGPRVGVEAARGRNFPVYNAHPTNLLAYVGLTPGVALRLAGETWLQLGAGVALSVVRPHFLLGLDSDRRYIELSNPAVVRSELSASLLQVF